MRFKLINKKTITKLILIIFLIVPIFSVGNKTAEVKAENFAGSKAVFSDAEGNVSITFRFFNHDLLTLDGFKTTLKTIDGEELEVWEEVFSNSINNKSHVFSGLEPETEYILEYEFYTPYDNHMEQPFPDHYIFRIYCFKVRKHST